MSGDLSGQRLNDPLYPGFGCGSWGRVAPSSPSWGGSSTASGMVDIARGEVMELQTITDARLQSTSYVDQIADRLADGDLARAAVPGARGPHAPGHRAGGPRPRVAAVSKCASSSPCGLAVSCRPAKFELLGRRHPQELALSEGRHHRGHGPWGGDAMRFWWLIPVVLAVVARPRRSSAGCSRAAPVYGLRRLPVGSAEVPGARASHARLFV